MTNSWVVIVDGYEHWFCDDCGWSIRLMGEYDRMEPWEAQVLHDDDMSAAP